MEYSSASEVPGSARTLFGASLYNGANAGNNGGKGGASEIATTSPLPEPTRVEGQDFVSDVSATQTPSRDQQLQAQQQQGNRDALGMSSNDAGGSAQMDVPIMYSDEELAVLAESFFSQRGEFDSGMGGDWWNTGNL